MAPRVMAPAPVFGRWRQSRLAQVEQCRSADSLSPDGWVAGVYWRSRPACCGWTVGAYRRGR
eukprot:9033946-Alexandrium_andersonii.AAC.1